MDLIKEKLTEIRNLPLIIEEIKSNYDMGLITLSEYLHQLGDVNKQFEDLVEWFEDEDISPKAMSFMLDNSRL